jgi:putative endonuclease
MPKKFCVYILANGKYGTTYIGMTSDWRRRIEEHKKHLIKGFTYRYNITKLVYIEFHQNFSSAATRENQLKDWHRQWKIRLIEEQNPDWEDLAEKEDFRID